MDARLIALARTVKARRRLAAPTIWVFSDPRRLLDPAPLLARLPPRLAGVVLRGASPDVARRVGRLCQSRRFVLLIAGNAPAPPLPFPPGLPFGLRGRHFSRGWVRRHPAGGAWRTSSAHDAPELIRARRGGARTVFLSPLFPTQSHPGAPSLGLLRFLSLSRETGGQRSGLALIALGGIDGARGRALRLAPIAGVAAIGALAGDQPVRGALAGAEKFP